MSFWNHERAEEAFTMWKEGASASEITRKLGTTRHAVIGKMWRQHGPRGDGLVKKYTFFPPEPWSRRQITKRVLETQSKGDTVASKRSISKTVSTARMAPAQDFVHVDTGPLVNAPVDESIMRPWQERRYGQCAYPILREGVTFSCCSGVKPGSNYCPGHGALMYARKAA